MSEICIVSAKGALELTDLGISINLSLGCNYVDLWDVIKINVTAF